MGAVVNAVTAPIKAVTNAVTSVVSKVPVVGTTAAGGIKTVVGAAIVNPTMVTQGLQQSQAGVKTAVGQVTGGSPLGTAALDAAGAAYGIPDLGGIAGPGVPGSNGNPSGPPPASLLPSPMPYSEFIGPTALNSGFPISTILIPLAVAGIAILILKKGKL